MGIVILYIYLHVYMFTYVPVHTTYFTFRVKRISSCVYVVRKQDFQHKRDKYKSKEVKSP